MDKKYFFFDIDGTLTDLATGIIVPSALAALKKLREAGHFVAVATGRAYYKARPVFEQAGFDNMVCYGGNGLVIDRKLVEYRPLDYTLAKALYDECLEKNYGILVAEDDSQKVYARDFSFYDQVGPRMEPTTYIIDEHYDPADREAIYKLYVAVPPEDEDELEALAHIGHLRLEASYLVIQPDDKIGGIYRMLDHVGGQRKDVVVFGDDYNDLVMFEDEAFHRVAMGNACQALKDKADQVAPRNVDDGIYKICEANGWFE